MILAAFYSWFSTFAEVLWLVVSLVCGVVLVRQVWKGECTPELQILAFGILGWVSYAIVELQAQFYWVGVRPFSYNQVHLWFFVSNLVTQICIAASGLGISWVVVGFKRTVILFIMASIANSFLQYQWLGVYEWLRDVEVIY